MAKVTQVEDASGMPAAAPKSKLKFSEYAVDQFKPNIVVRRLADPRQQKTLTAGLLFTALQAWVVANDDRQFIRDSVVRRIGDVLAERHRVNIERWASKPGASFVATAIELSLTPFLEEVFDPIGGMAAIMDSCSKTELEHARQSRADNARSVIDLMSVLHLYAVTGGKDSHPAKMSIQFGCALVAELQVRRRRATIVSQALSADRLRDRWGEMARSSALIMRPLFWNIRVFLFLITYIRVLPYNFRAA